MRTALLYLSLVVMGSTSLTALAQQQTVNAPNGNPNQSLSTSASLDFTVKLGKFLFFQVGTDNYPITNSPNTVVFEAKPSTPNPVSNANNTQTNWSGTAPVFNLQSTTNVLDVAVRSNAGQISLKTTVSSALSSGSNTLPLANLSITSSSTNLPAPPVPNSGSGSSVNVTGTSFSNLVTTQSATWTFNYNLPTNAFPGNYQGQITFTAASP